MFHWLSSPISPCPSVRPAMVTSFPSSSPLPSSSSPPPSPSLDAPRLPCHPGPLKCFCAPRHQISAKSAPQKAHNRDKAKFATKLRKLRKDCVNVNNEE